MRILIKQSLINVMKKRELKESVWLWILLESKDQKQRLCKSKLVRVRL